MILVRLHSRDAWHNLAAEEWLLDCAQAETILLFYVNDPAVVIGRHQNPWAETNPAALAASNMRLARRTSGGGAVWHDPGVLNFSFLMPRRDYRPLELHSTLIRALERLGVRAHIERHSALFVDQHKVSGSAFRLRGQVALHHGTLLISADLDQLRIALTPSCRIRSSAAIPSIRAPVENLATLLPGLMMADCIAALTAEVEHMWGPIDRCWDEDHLDALEVSIRADRHRSWQWQFGETPPFTAEISIATDTGRPELWLADVRDGRIVSLSVQAPIRLEQALACELSGQPFDPAIVTAMLTSHRAARHLC